MNTKPVNRTPFEIFVKPVLENLLAPIFAYIAAYSISAVIVMIFTGVTSIPILHPESIWVAQIVALLVLSVTAVLTVMRFLSDDALIVFGKMMQEPRIQKLQAENDRLKHQIENLLENVSAPVVQQNNDGFDNEDLEVTKTVSIDELDAKSQKIFDGALWLWQRATDGEKITKDVMTGKNGQGMAQRAWSNAYQTLQNIQAITADKEPLLLDRQMVVERLYEHLRG